MKEITIAKSSSIDPTPEKEKDMKSYLMEIEKDISKVTFAVEETKIPDYMEPEDSLKVINKYSTLHSVPFELAAAGITKLVQDGGTNQSKKNLTVVVAGIPFELNKLRMILQSIDKNLTVRKFAKGARDLISKIAYINKWPGPLTKDLARINPNLIITPELAPWCNEIHSDNYNCPNEIRDALIRREEQFKLLFKQKTDTNPKKTNVKPRSKRGKQKKGK